MFFSNFIALVNNITPQPDCTSSLPAVLIGHGTVEPLVDTSSRRIIPNGDMHIALHELNYNHTFLTDITMEAFCVSF